jgi:ankyrin repeat protein
MNDSSLKLDPTALIDAVKNDNIDLVRKLITQGVDVNIKQNDGGTPLMFAAGIGNIDCTKELIAHGADVNVKYGNGMTPLMLCINAESSSNCAYVMR